jgi:hypothetical protein
MSPRSWRPNSSLANNEKKIDNENNNNNNNLKIMNASIESDSTILNSFREQQKTVKNNFTNNNNNQNLQSTSSSLTFVSKDYDSIMRSSNIAKQNIPKNTTTATTTVQTPLKNITLNNKIKKNDSTIEFKLSKGLKLKQSSSVFSSTKMSGNQKM